MSDDEQSTGPYRRDGETVYATAPESDGTPDERDWPDHTDPEWLHYRYWVMKDSQRDMAERANVCKMTISNHMSKHDIPTRDKSKAKSLGHGGDELLWNEEWVREQYIDKELSDSEIAKMRGVGETAVRMARQRYDIEGRSTSEAIKIKHKKEYGDRFYNDPEWLKHQYQELGKSSLEIADEHGWNPSTIIEKLNEFGIKTRSDTSARLLQYKKEKCPTPDAAPDTVTSEGIDASYRDLKDRQSGCYLDYRDPRWLRKQVEKGLSQKEIADKSECDISPRTIQRWLNRHGIERDD